ncbi:MAG: hypothetical protein ACLRZO_15875, partial [Eggerthella lenta]
ITPKHTMAIPTINKATCTMGFTALNNLTTPFVTQPLNHIDHKIRVKRDLKCARRLLCVF